MLNLNELLLSLLEGKFNDKLAAEALISSREPNWCVEAANNAELLENMVKVAFMPPAISQNLLKTLINIAYQAPLAKPVIATSIPASRPPFIDNIQIYSEESFLLTRLFFILAVDNEACRVLTEDRPWIEGTIVSPTVSSFTPESGQTANDSLLDCLNLRYLQVSLSKVDQEVVINEISSLLQKLPRRDEFVFLIGAAFHVLSGIRADCKPYRFVGAQELCLYLKIILNHKSSPDYRALMLNIAYFMCEHDYSMRKNMRHMLLPSSDKEPQISHELWKDLLSHPDSHISFSSGELLYTLCNHKVSRLVAHLGFGPCAGYLQRKGKLYEAQTTDASNTTDKDELSSDEEYFMKHPQTPDTTPIPKPETEEEIREYEALLGKINEFNSRALRQ